MALEFYYDAQIRRYLLQFVRIFNQFQYQTGRDATGNAILRVVPATFASMDRQVNSIIQNNSENVLLSTPQISCWITSLKIAPDRRQDPNYVRTINVFQRDIDPITKQYTDKLGSIYNIESFMPVPYDLTLQTDIWTSSELQKQQILEQILVLFNPMIDLQTSNNPFDWTALTVVELQEVKWSSRSYPAGSTDNIEVASLTFRVPIWLTPPSKVKRQNIIQQIIIDIGQLEKMNDENGKGFYWADADLISRLIVTPNDFSVIVTGNEITLFNPDDSILDIEGNPMTWITLLQKYGKFRPSISQVRLKKAGRDIDDNTDDLVGILQLDPIDPMKLIWTLDIQTLPANTLLAITAVIDPSHGVPPGLPVSGQRYITLQDIPIDAAWNGLIVVGKTNKFGLPVFANENDIIEYNGTQWIVVFDSLSHITPEYVINSNKNQQLYWNGSTWLLSVDGEYAPGYWRLAM